MPDFRFSLRAGRSELNIKGNLVCKMQGFLLFVSDILQILLFLFSTASERQMDKVSQHSKITSYK